MSDNTNNTPQNGEQNNAVEPPKQQDAPKPSEAQDAPDSTKAFDEDYVKQLRSEAAKYRTERNELRQQLEEVQATVAQMQETQQKTVADKLAQMEARLNEADNAVKVAELKAIRAKVASEIGLPTPLADRLQGEDEETIRADAEALRATLPSGVTNVRTGNATPPPPQSRAQELIKRTRGQAVDAWSPEIQKQKGGGALSS